MLHFSDHQLEMDIIRVKSHKKRKKGKKKGKDIKDIQKNIQKEISVPRFELITF